MTNQEKLIKKKKTLLEKILYRFQNNLSQSVDYIKNMKFYTMSHQSQVSSRKIVACNKAYKPKNLSILIDEKAFLKKLNNIQVSEVFTKQEINKVVKFLKINKMGL